MLRELQFENILKISICFLLKVLAEKSNINNIRSLAFLAFLFAHAIFWRVLGISWVCQAHQPELNAAFGVSLQLRQNLGKIKFGIISFPKLPQDLILFLGPLWLHQFGELVEAGEIWFVELFSYFSPVNLASFPHFFYCLHQLSILLFRPPHFVLSNAIFWFVLPIFTFSQLL